MSIINASKLLNRSRRTIERYLQQYRKIGIQFVIHGNTGRPPANKLPSSLRRQVQTLIREKYYDFNLQHLAELLEANEGITVKLETLRSWAHDIHHVKRAKRRRPQVRKRRERMESAGLLLQMQRACKELGIEIIFANSPPQGKGRVERSFDTFQDRLVPDFV